MKRILFQGDSITDVQRNRDPKATIDALGFGYPLLVAAELGLDRPGEFECIDRGISGNRIVDLYARIRADLINPAPDFVSILIGVNDVWHDFPGKNGVPAEKFEKIYRMLLEEVREALPDTKILLMEPFCLRGTATDRLLDDGTPLYDIFRAEVEKRAAAASRIASSMHLPFLPLMQAFDGLAEKTAPGDWLIDGVHPTPAGHEYIAREWMRMFKEMGI